jgi:anti-sigma regulatory factor (Ser/Thr protein kinase)
MNAQRSDERQRAGIARTRSRALREHAQDLRDRATFESGRAVESLRRDGGPIFGEHGGGLSFRLPRLPIVLALVRHELRRWLEREQVPAEACADVILACSEACANAMEHPQETERAAFEVGVSLREGVLELAVRDYGSWDPDEDAEGDARGRGLEMIRSLMDEVTIVRGTEGTEVTMRRRLELPA